MHWTFNRPRQNFEKIQTRQIFHGSLKEHPIFSVLQRLVGKYFNKVDNFCILLHYALRTDTLGMNSR